MGGLAIGLAIGFAAAGGVSGLAVSFLSNFNLYGGPSRGLHPVKGALAGVFLGAALGGGTGWVIEDGPNRYMEDRAREAIVNNCLKRIDAGEKFVLGLDAQGERACVPLTPQL
jgi:hypothetical protein